MFFLLTALQIAGAKVHFICSETTTHWNKKHTQNQITSGENSLHVEASKISTQDFETFLEESNDDDEEEETFIYLQTFQSDLLSFYKNSSSIRPEKTFIKFNSLKLFLLFQNIKIPTL